MKAAAQTQPIRDAHRDLTRARILDAAIELLKVQELESLTVAAVAAEAGVTERTIYRHFASREELLAAVWPKLQARVGSRGFADTALGLAAMPLWLFANFDQEEGPVRASAFSKAGRELRMAVNSQRQAAFLAAVKEARPDLEGAPLRRLAAVAQLINSAWGWAVMRDFWGLSGPEAGEAASEALIALLRLDPAAVRQFATESASVHDKD
ncbi:MAG: TetR family transcriptional regulator [Hyphomonadaceae bacterium]